MSYRPSEDLLERLASPDVTSETVIEFLREQRDHIHQSGFEAPIIPDFFTHEDLDGYKQAQEWWPADVPVQWACPSIYQLCTEYQEQDPRIGATFMERLRLKSVPVTKWLHEEKRDVANPNETLEERRKRLNAEAVQRHRAKAGTGAAAEHARAVSAAYAAYMAICAERKVVKAEWDAKVAEARAHWQQVKKTPSE